MSSTKLCIAKMPFKRRLVTAGLLLWSTLLVLLGAAVELNFEDVQLLEMEDDRS